MKKLYISIITALVIFSGSGCKKYLEQAPDQRTQVNSVQKVAELLTSAYPESNYIAFTESASDNTEDKGVNAGDEPRFVVQPYYWEDNDDDSEDTPTHYWNSCYEAIAAANQALEVIENNPDDLGYLPYKGEALLARAYAHFMLVTLFAQTYDPEGSNESPGIPYVLKPETVVSGQYERGTVASVYQQIEKDLLEGLPLLSNNVYNVPKYHFNTAAANAFAARFFLFKKDYANVVKYASAISPGNSFQTIIRPWNTRYNVYTSAEMRTNFTAATEPSTLMLVETASSWARTRSARYGFGQNLVNRLFNTVNVTGARWGHGLYITPDAPHYNLLKWNEYFVRTSPNATIGYPYTMVPVFTADEALMNRAEAYVGLGNYEAALADLNTFASTRITSYNAAAHSVTLAKIATFYNIQDPKEGLIRTILDFKKAEFIQEGLRWFDILRHKIVVTHNVKAVATSTTIELGADDPRRLFQMPVEVELAGIERNPR